MVVHDACIVLSSILYVIQTLYNSVYTERVIWMVGVDGWKYKGQVHE